MECWKPDPDEPPLLEWYEPLVAFARRARARSCAVPIYIDEFEFCGRMQSPSRGEISVYEHAGNGREILADAHGRSYKFVVHRSGPSPGRFVEIEPDDAAWKVLADASPMKLWRRAPAVSSEQLADSIDQHPANPGQAVSDTGTEGRTVRHLRVIDCTGD